MLNVQLDKGDIRTQIQGDNFLIRAEGSINVVLTKAAMKELIKDYIEITVGDTDELGKQCEYGVKKEIIKQMPHLESPGLPGEIMNYDHFLPTNAQDIKKNFEKGFDYFKKLILG